MCPGFYPASLDFGSDFAGAVGPTYDPDYVSLPQSPAPGTVLFWAGPASPAGNVTAFITGDAAHFTILSVTAYRVFFYHGPHYQAVGSSDGVKPLAVPAGYAVSVQVRYDLTNAADTLRAVLQIHGDTPAWAPDSLVPMTVAVIPARQIKTSFGQAVISMPQGGNADLPILVTNVTGPATDVTYSLPLGWAPTTSIGGVAIASGLVMDQAIFRQIPAGGLQSGVLHFTLPPSGIPAGNYPFNIAMWAFDGVPPNNNNPVSPSLTLSAAPGRISVNLVAGGTIVQSGDALTLEVPVRITLGMQRGVATVTFSPGSLPQGVSVPSPPSYVLSANDYPSVPEWPPTDVDVTGSLMGRITLAVNLNALVRDNPTAEINWSAYNGQQTGLFLVDIAVQAKRVTPLAPVDLRPQNGASGIQNAPYLFFVDPGAGTTSAADSFEFLVSQNNVVVDPQHVLTGPAVIGNPLSAPGVTWFETLPTGAVTLEVWGKNRAGTGPPSMSTFTVSAPPPPPSPQISAKQQGKNIVLTGQGFEASRSVTVLVEVQNSISNQQDTRHGTTVLQSTSDRKINDTFNPVDLFANEPTPYPGTIAHGELVFVTAANTDAGSFTPGHPGVSNIFSFNWS